MWRIKHFFKIILIHFYYNKYVANNIIIKQDIDANILARSPKKIEYNTSEKFKHLMTYYSDFSFLFFWRINKNNYINKILFYNDCTSICKIFKNIDLQGGVVSYHPFSTIINAKEIGENFIFRNNTTIGNTHNDNDLRPIIGDNVELGANVVIIGRIKIGNNVTVGAGTVVVKDIPSNSVVVGNPARVLMKK